MNQLKQVTLTYLTFRWIWFVVAFLLLMILPGFIGDGVPPAMPLGMPCMLGITFIVAVTKWQFANPRARLMPNFVRPHLAVLGAILCFFFVLLPLVLAAVRGISPLGPLSFTLLLGACTLYAILLNRGMAMVPAIAIFFSGFSSHSASFWFENARAFWPAHMALLLLGGGMIGYCLWFISHLTEEMDEYQTMPIGGVGLSRVERAEQRRLLGQQMKKQKLMGWISDRWLDRGFGSSTKKHNPVALTEYGLARSPAVAATCGTCLAFAIYGMLLMQIGFMRTDDKPTDPAHPHLMFVVFATILPIGAIGLALMMHRTRMSQELLYPARREEYYNRLLAILAKRAAYLWLGMQASLGIIAYATHTYPAENTWELILKFAVLSFAVQLPAFGLSLRLGHWNSHFAYLFGMYAVVGMQMAVISYWWQNPAEGTWPVICLTLVGHAILGAVIFTWARRKWLAAELA